ncbi:MAG: gas vesicle protein [Phycisphaerae bacterium]
MNAFCETADAATAEEVAIGPEERVSLCEVLDRALNKGVVVAGDVVISVADIDLVYLGLQLVLTSVETARQMHFPLAGEATGSPSKEEPA